MIYVPGVDGDTHTRAMELPHLHSHRVMWETCVGGQSNELFLYACDDDYIHEREGFVGWMLTEHGGFTPVMGGWDGHLYVNKIDESFLMDEVGKDRYMAMNLIREGITSILTGEAILERWVR
jgi:hypothetical protein